MSEHKFTEAELLEAAELVDKVYKGHFTFGDMLRQAARAVAEVGALWQAVRESSGTQYANVPWITDRVAAILRAKEEKQGGN
jgi:hypothetical protein